MGYRLYIPPDIDEGWAELPPQVKVDFTTALLRVAEALRGPTDEPQVGMRVAEVQPPQYMLTQDGYWLLLEVRHPERRVQVTRVAQAQ